VWKVQDWRYGKRLAEQSGLHQADLTAISNAAAAQVRAALEKQQAAEKIRDDIDAKATRRKRMTSLRMKIYAALLPMVLAGCASREVVVPIAATCPVPPAPPAWAMAEPSNSLQLLDELFSISAPGSSPTKQP
jgi:hypothetical protein